MATFGVFTRLNFCLQILISIESAFFLHPVLLTENPNNFYLFFGSNCSTSAAKSFCKHDKLVAFRSSIFVGHPKITFKLLKAILNYHRLHRTPSTLSTF